MNKAATLTATTTTKTTAAAATTTTTTTTAASVPASTSGPTFAPPSTKVTTRSLLISIAPTSAAVKTEAAPRPAQQTAVSSGPADAAKSAMAPPGSPNASSICVLGSSGSGKTTLVKSLLKLDGRPVVIFNSAGDDYGDLEAEEREWNPDSLEDLRNCNVVFEDLIAPAPKKMATVKKVVHYFQRRRNVSLYVLSHEIPHTGLFSLLGQMDKIYVTSGPKNAKLYRDLARFQFHVEPSTVEALKSKVFHYLEINPKTGTYKVLNSKLEDVMGSLRNDLVAKRSEVEKCLQAFPRQSAILMQIFDIIFKNFPSSLLTPNDLCIPVKVGSKRSKTRKVPIIDFLLSLRMQAEPDPEVVLLKKFMDSKMTLPRTLITNVYLRDTVRPDKTGGKRAGRSSSDEKKIKRPRLSQDPRRAGSTGPPKKYPVGGRDEENPEGDEAEDDYFSEDEDTDSSSTEVDPEGDEDEEDDEDEDEEEEEDGDVEEDDEDDEGEDEEDHEVPAHHSRESPPAFVISRKIKSSSSRHNNKKKTKNAKRLPSSKLHRRHLKLSKRGKKSTR